MYVIVVAKQLLQLKLELNKNKVYFWNKEFKEERGILKTMISEAAHFWGIECVI